jgi:hypothetical protein
MRLVSILRTAPLVEPSKTLNCCHPPMPTTRSPTANEGDRDSITSPTVPPIITALSGCGGA